ncbi:hypothetical protein DCAR_0415280 [Daucus carota subsp. sativus]|uniref:Uncharacterized protein n=1 Tax=Daucus carota subsp. sativus TaxID=79200 RepID=A0A165A9W6_DAUCS|nr:hypothetical protein DCAR_0415280 [Daucus carota subsp. sativus]
MDFLTPPSAAPQTLTPLTIAFENLAISDTSIETDMIKTHMHKPDVIRKISREESHRRALIRQLYRTLKADNDPHTTNVVSSKERLKQVEHQLRALKRLGDQEFVKSVRLLCFLAKKDTRRVELRRRD